MSAGSTLYCLDANVLIVPWQTYYSPTRCPSYWDLLNDLGHQGKIFIPRMVCEEITRTDDDLAKWLTKSEIPVHEIDGGVTKCLSQIYASDPMHQYLVDNTKQRSLADPWVIAHAMNENACVITKENLATAANSKRIKIPNVCVKMGVRCIDDFAFMDEMKIKFYTFPFPDRSSI